MDEVQKSIIKTYRKEIYSKFIKAVKDYKLINENDKIMVCISGGKDSFLLAKCMQELKNHGMFDFDIEYVVMNPGYNVENEEMIKENAKKLNIPIKIFKSDIFEVAYKQEKSPCYLCARMRRGFLYNKAKELGCNKIALGHHFDDVIETTLLSMFYSSEIRTMVPKLHSDNFEGIELIRPLYLIKEKDIIAWKNKNNLTFLNCACKFTYDVKYDNMTSKRNEIKKLIEKLKEKDDFIDMHIFKSMENINLNCVLGYIDKKDEKHSFIDEYEEY